MLEMYLAISFFVNVFLFLFLLNHWGLYRDIDGFISILMDGNLSHRLRIRQNGILPVPKIIDRLNRFAEQLKRRITEQTELQVRLEATLKSIPEGVILLDEDGRIRFINRAVEENLGFDADIGEGARITDDLVMPEIRNFFLFEDTRKHQKKKVLFVENTGKHVELKMSPIYIREGSHYIGTVIIARDITVERGLYETRRDFVANVSHELKTPITSIKGYAETLLAGAIEDHGNTVRFLTIIKNQSDRMEHLIKDLLILSKIEMGAVPMTLDMVYVASIVQEVFSLAKVIAEPKGLSLNMTTNAENLHVEADHNRLFQIINNLVMNAVKYTTEGVVTVDIKRKNGACILSVSDTGCGIPREALPRLGERFFRVDSSRSRELGGTGLGLAIVKHLVLSHQWEMKISSEVGKGTKVEIHIPL